MKPKMARRISGWAWAISVCALFSAACGRSRLDRLNAEVPRDVRPEGFDISLETQVKPSSASLKVTNLSREEISFSFVGLDSAKIYRAWDKDGEPIVINRSPFTSISYSLSLASGASETFSAGMDEMPEEARYACFTFRAVEGRLSTGSGPPQLSKLELFSPVFDLKSLD